MANQHTTRYGQQPNTITDVATFLTLGQSLKDLERLVNSFGRTLTDNERRLQQTLPGMIKTFQRVEKEFNASGTGKLSASQAADLKVMLANEQNILKWLNQLAQFNPKTGLSKNERNDTSFLQYAHILEDVMNKLTASMERAYKQWNGYNNTVASARARFGLPPINTSSPPPVSTTVSAIPPNVLTSATSATLTAQKDLVNAIEVLIKRGQIPKNVATASRLKANLLQSTNPPPRYPNRNFPNGPNYFTSVKDAHIADRLKKRDDDIAKFLEDIRKKEEAIRIRTEKKELHADLFANSGLFQAIHKAFGSLPVIGKITGLLSKMSEGGSAMNQVGKTLFSAFGENSKLGKLGSKLAGPLGVAIGATAVAVGAIYKQLKKSSPILQAVSDIFNLAWNLLWMPLGNALGTALLPMAEWLIDFAIAFNKLFADFSWENLVQFYYSALQLLWGPLSSLLTSLPMLIINTLIDNAIRFFDTIGLSGVADALRDAKDFMKEIRDKVVNLPTILGDAMAKIPELIKKAFTSEASHIGSTFSEMGDKASKGDVAGMFDTAFRASPGGRLLEKVGILGSGGIVTRPSLNIVGEAGPEAVIPLDKMGGLGSTYVININGDVYGVSDLESRIERVIQRTANKSYYR